MNFKRLYFDLETSQMIFKGWRTGKQFVRADQVLKESKIISLHWKWEGEDEVHNMDWGLKKQCDKRIVKKAVKLFDEADEIIAHNGDRFDMRWIYGRAMVHGISMRPKYITHDTYKIVKKIAYLPSYSLKECCKAFDLPLKIDAGGISTWDKVQFDKDQEALDHLLYYGDGDIISLEALFKHLRPYVFSKQHYHIDHVSLSDKDVATKFFCPECGTLMKWNKTYTTKAGTKQHYMKCRDGKCGTFNKISNRDYQNYGRFCLENNIQ